MTEETADQTIARLEAELAAAKTSAAPAAPATEPVANALVVGQLVVKDKDTEHESSGIVLVLYPAEPVTEVPGTFSAPTAKVGWFASDSVLPESALAALAAE